MKIYDITSYWFTSTKRLNREEVERTFNDRCLEGSIIEQFETKEDALEAIKSYEKAGLNYNSYHHNYEYEVFELTEEDEDGFGDIIEKAFSGYNA